MKRPARALMLVLMLAAPTYAGDMGNGTPQPPPPPPQTTSDTSAETPGDEATVEGDMGNGATVTVTETALSLLPTLLALL